jgi:hypothetical protein
MFMVKIVDAFTSSLLCACPRLHCFGMKFARKKESPEMHAKIVTPLRFSDSAVFANWFTSTSRRGASSNPSASKLIST